MGDTTIISIPVTAEVTVVIFRCGHMCLGIRGLPWRVQGGTGWSRSAHLYTAVYMDCCKCSIWQSPITACKVHEGNG